MTKEEAIERLKFEQQVADRESAHENADDVLCQLLISLGHQDVVTEFQKVRKWYA